MSSKTILYKIYLKKQQKLSQTFWNWKKGLTKQNKIWSDATRSHTCDMAPDCEDIQETDNVNKVATDDKVHSHQTYRANVDLSVLFRKEWCV